MAYLYDESTCTSDGSISVISEYVSFVVLKCWRSGNMETEPGAVASADPGPASMCRVQFPSVLSSTILSKAHLYL